ncbi:MAG: hypothetical protein ACK5KM_08655 [Hyphomicrobiaceae bacterium]
MSHVRLLFPAATWNVLASRQLLHPVLASADASQGWGNIKRTPTTAIAIRYQRGVRMAGREHITQTAMMRDLAGEDVSETAAAVAVRLRVGDESVWLVSADLPEGCAQPHNPTPTSTSPSTSTPTSTSATGQGTFQPADFETDACRAHLALARWSQARRGNERLIIGGPHTVTVLAASSRLGGKTDLSTSSATGKNACPTQQVSILDGNNLKVAHAEKRNDAGCLARLDVTDANQ